MTRYPLLSALLCALAVGLALLPPAVQESLYFDNARLVAGDWIGLASGHWMHVDTAHLAWNIGALALLAGLIESRSRSLLLWRV